MLILKLIAAYLALAVDPPNPEPDPPAVVVDDDPDPGAIENLDLDDDPDPAPGGGENDPPDDPDAKLSAAVARAEKAERGQRETAERLAAAERQRQQQSTGPSQEQRLFEQEEAILADPKSTEQQRYWVNANRTLRSNERMAKEALFSSQDAADRTDYNALLTTMPLAKKYQQRVEAKVAEFREKGQLVPRRIALKLLIGDDIVEGKVKTATKKPKVVEGDPSAARQVPRGTPGGVRSDVRRSAPTERDKRRARLENQQI